MITAAAGGVGSLLVQLARSAGVTSIVGRSPGPRPSGDLAIELGADVAVDYTADGWADQIRAAIGDGDGRLRRRERAGRLRAPRRHPDDGRLVRFGAASGQSADASGRDRPGRAHVFGLGAIGGPDDNRALVLDAFARAAAGTLRPTIGQRFPMAEADRAHAAIEARCTTGKTLLIP